MTGAAGMRDLLRQRDFRLLLTGQTLSMFGDTALWLALAVWAKSLTGTSAAAGMVIFACGTLLLLSDALPVVLAGKVLFGVGIPWVIVALYTLLQRTTPAPLQGRVYSAVEVFVGTPQTISIALGAILVALVDYRALLLVEALVVAGAGAWLLTRVPASH